MELFRRTAAYRLHSPPGPFTARTPLGWRRMGLGIVPSVVDLAAIAVLLVVHLLPLLPFKRTAVRRPVGVHRLIYTRLVVTAPQGPPRWHIA